MNITPKQKKFSDLYLIDLNATSAYKKVYGVKSDEVAKAAASRLLINVNVKAYIASKQKKLSEKLEISQQRVLEELALIGFSSITDFLRIKTGKKRIEGKWQTVQSVELLDTDKIDKRVIPAIASIKQGINGIELKLHDKENALITIARHLGMFNDKLDITSKGQSLTADDISKLNNEQKLQYLQLKKIMKGNAA